MKEYYGYFRSCDTSIDENGQLFLVSIITEYNTTNTHTYSAITLTDTPFTVEYEGNTNEIQKPYKCSTATVSFLSNTFIPELTDTNNNNVLVKLKKWRDTNQLSGNVWTYSYSTPTNILKTGTVNNTTLYPYPMDDNLWETVWVGFATPNTYSQAFEGVFDVIEVNAQDALSTLQYVDYSPYQGDKSFVSFWDIIKKYAIRNLGVYSYVFITDAVKTQVLIDQDVLHSLYIDENNFFDEDGTPMKVLDVIGHICNYLNLTVIPFGQTLYFINYDAIKNGHNSYYCWDDTLLDGLNPNNFQLISDHNIDKDDFAENGTSLSVLDPFNKVTVKDDMYPYDSIMPDIEDENNIVNTTEVDDYSPLPWELPMREGNRWQYAPKYMMYHSKILNLFTIGIFESAPAVLMARYLNFKNNIGVTTYYYSWDTVETMVSHQRLIPDSRSGSPNDTGLDYDRTNYYVGCGLLAYQYSVYKFIDTLSYQKINNFNPKTAIAFFLPIPLAYTRMFDNTCLTYEEGYYSPVDEPTQQMFVLEKKILVDKYTRLKLSGNFEFIQNEIALPINFDLAVKCDEDFCWEFAQLQVRFYDGSQSGNETIYYYDGENWQEPSYFSGTPYFKLPLECDSDKFAFNTDYAIVSNYSKNANKDFEINFNLPNIGDKAKVVGVKFTIYRPHCPKKGLLTPLVLLKDFDVKVITTKGIVTIDTYHQTNPEWDYDVTIKDNKKSDAEYSISLNDKKYEDYPDIDYKITTYNNTSPNYSSTLLTTSYNENGNYNINSTYFLRNTTIYNKGIGKVLIPEEHKLTSIQKQYSSPTITLDVNLKESLGIKPWSTLHYHYFNDSTFVVDSMSYDYRWNKNTIKLLDKK